MNLVKRFVMIGEDRSFLRKLVALAVPVAIQGFLNTTLNLIDSVMIGSLGETPIAAVGLANKVFFVFSLLLFGICSGSGILTAQYWGKGDVPNIRRVLGLSLLLGLVAALLFTVPAIFMPEIVMRIFTPNQDTIRIGASYLVIIGFTYPLTAVTNCYISILRSVNQVKAPVLISLAALMVNCSINYLLIFGNFGAPKLGVAGAAIGTLVARIVECGSLLFMVYWTQSPAAAKLRELVHWKKEFVRKYFQTATPVILNEFMWGLGVTMYSLVYGRMGDNAMAAITITQTFEQVMTVVFQSISAATAVMLGNEMGADRLKRAEEYSKHFILLQFLLTLVIGVIWFFLRWPVVHMYHITPEVGIAVSRCFLSFIALMPFKMFNYVNVVGILRSGGDTKAALFLDTTGVWLIGIPMAYLGGLVWKLPIYIVYAMVMLEEVYKFILGIIRYRQKKWLRNLVIHENKEII